MKSMITKVAMATLACMCVGGMNAQEGQKTYPQQEPMKPGMSEYWTPQPKVVTPGDIKTNSAPSDAIVLFDGKDLLLGKVLKAVLLNGMFMTELLQ